MPLLAPAFVLILDDFDLILSSLTSEEPFFSANEKDACLILLRAAWWQRTAGRQLHWAALTGLPQRAGPEDPAYRTSTVGEVLLCFRAFAQQ